MPVESGFERQSVTGTDATLLLMERSPACVRKQLRHPTITMTVDIYGHRIPAEGRIWERSLADFAKVPR